MIGEKELANHKFDEVIPSAKEAAKRRRVKLDAHLLVGHPVKAISDIVEKKGFDTLVIGRVGHTQFYSMLMGGTAERLAGLAPCTVIIVK